MCCQSHSEANALSTQKMMINLIFHVCLSADLQKINLYTINSLTSKTISYTSNTEFCKILKKKKVNLYTSSKTGRGVWNVTFNSIKSITNLDTKLMKNVKDLYTKTLLREIKGSEKIGKLYINGLKDSVLVTWPSFSN